MYFLETYLEAEQSLVGAGRSLVAVVADRIPVDLAGCIPVVLVDRSRVVLVDRSRVEVLPLCSLCRRYSGYRNL